MTRVARNELNDARHLVSRLENGESGDGYNADYKAAIALLRAVGHKLSVVDGQADNRTKALVKQHFETRCRTSAYFNRLKCERDRLLKDEVASLRRVCERVETLEARLSMLSGPTDLGIPHRSYFKAVYRYFVTDGPFSGLEACNVLKQGITFWERELAWLDSQLTFSADEQVPSFRKRSTAPDYPIQVRHQRRDSAGATLAAPSVAAALYSEMRHARLAGLSKSEQFMHGAKFIMTIAPYLEPEAAKRAILSVACPTESCEE